MYDKYLIFPSFHRVHLVCKWWKASICGAMGVHLILLFIIIAIAGVKLQVLRPSYLHGSKDAVFHPLFSILTSEADEYNFISR